VIVLIGARVTWRKKKEEMSVFMAHRIIPMTLHVLALMLHSNVFTSGNLSRCFYPTITSGGARYLVRGYEGSPGGL